MIGIHHLIHPIPLFPCLPALTQPPGNAGVGWEDCVDEGRYNVSDLQPPCKDFTPPPAGEKEHLSAVRDDNLEDLIRYTDWIRKQVL